MDSLEIDKTMVVVSIFIGFTMGYIVFGLVPTISVHFEDQMTPEETCMKFQGYAAIENARHEGCEYIPTTGRYKFNQSIALMELRK